MNLHQGLKFTFAFMTTVFVAMSAYAQEETATPSKEENIPLVEVHYPQDNLASYKERRSDHGAYFSLGYEDLVLKNFISIIDGRRYSENFGSSGIALIRAGLEYKYNIGLGSIAAGAEFGSGEVSGKDTVGDRKLSITKYGVSAKYAADMIMDEPYAVPYVGINIWQMELTDKTTTTSIKESLNMGYNYTLGVMLQLDWIDYETAKKATFDYGLENTFIDIYATQYASSGSAADPDASTDFIYGANLRFEF